MIDIQKLTLCTLMVASAAAAHADPLDDFIRTSMRNNNVPGAVVEVLKAGKVEKISAYGVSSVELQVPSRIDDVYLLASVTKVFTSTAVFLLIQDGKLKLDEPVGEVVPNLPAAWRSLTIRQCLSHSTGLPDIFDDDSPVPIAWTRKGLFSILARRPFAYPTGTQSRYEQTDYLLLRLAVERLSGKPIQNFIAERILKPLGMKSASYGDGRDVVPGRVSFYWRYPPAPDRMHIVEVNGKAVPSPDKIWTDPPYWADYDMGGVGLNMTARDLAKFDTALWSGKILRHDLLDEMVKPITLPNGKRAAFTLAWEVGPAAGDRIVYFDGAGAVVYAHDLDTDTSFIVMTNCNGGNPWAILNALFARFSPNAQLQ